MKLKRTNIEISSEKISHAKKITGLKTTKEIVDFALERLSTTSKALGKIFELEGKIKLHAGYSYKKARI